MYAYIFVPQWHQSWRWGHAKSCWGTEVPHTDCFNGYFGSFHDFVTFITWSSSRSWNSPPSLGETICCRVCPSSLPSSFLPSLRLPDWTY